jgi:gliding motility-associated-like protein
MKNQTIQSLCFFTLFLLVSLHSEAQVTASGGNTTNGNAGYKINWTVNPFDREVFVENKGQFTADINNGDKILYGAQVGDVYTFITNHGIIYKYTEHPEVQMSPDRKHYKFVDPDELDLSLKPTEHYLIATWEGSGNNISTIAADEQTYYDTYPTAEKGTIRANVFKKVICRNVYPGIDVEYVFPKGKGGIKYTLVVHPGADLSLVKLKYKGAENMFIDKNGNVDIGTGWGRFVDHAPVSYYGDDNSPTISEYKLNNNEESFTVNNLNATKTLMVDPWVTNWTDSTGAYYGGTSGYDGAYDVDFDYAGNVYVYGGWDPFTLVKFNSAGVEQWSYNTTNFTELYYGDFCVDKASEKSFCLEGFGGGTSALTDEVSATGGLILSFPPAGTSSLDEQWRATYELCDHIILVAGGGTNVSMQGETLDTNLSTAIRTNILGAGTPLHDFSLIATDPLLDVGYMATARSVVYPTVDDNDLVQMPLPSMTPVTYNVADNFTFEEVGSVGYIGPGTYLGSKAANGMNGMAVSPDWVYMYDGLNLKQLFKNNGNLNASATLPGTTSFDWGGLDVDLCDDIYAGNQSNVLLYNSSLTQTGTIGPFWGNVYDVVLGNGVLSSIDSTLYVCGKGFLSSVKLNTTNTPVVLKTRTVFCSCNCSATGTATFCGNPDTVGVSYLWSTGQTTHTATGLCPGNTYTLTITLGCADQVQDTFNLPFAGTLTVAKSQTPYSCNTDATASVTLSGGSSPYTYSWSTGATTSNIGGLIPGDYCVTVTDHTGCQDSVCYIITGDSLPNIVVTPTPDTVCSGSGVSITASGGVSYVWAPTSGLSCTSCSNPTASPGSTTTYTVTGTDASGCSNTANAVVVVKAPPVITIAAPGDTVCIGGSVSLTASGAVTYTWTPSAGLSCTGCPNPTATPSTTTIYTVKGTDAEGCTSTKSVTVYIALPPTISVISSQSSVCAGTTVSLQATATNITSPYTWEPGSMRGATVSVTPTVTTTYTVSASSGCGTATATVTISVNDIPVTAFSADVTNGCYPLCVQFRDKSTVGTGAITQWGWSFGNGDTLSTKDPIYCFPKPGVYSVSLTTITDSGCSGSLKVTNMITVYSAPVANFTAAPQPATILEPTVQFTNGTTDEYGIIYWIWNFGEPGDTVSNLKNPEHTYQDTGTFCPVLVAVNEHGCTDTVTNCLVINPIFTCYIPDAFSPNGDGVNDEFEVKGRDIKSFEMYIFDRWGTQLFHTTDINDGWKGEVNNAGTVCQEDAYVYLIDVYDNKDQKHNFMGTVNLIR